MLPIQFGIDAQLASWVGSPVRATFVSFALGAAVLFLPKRRVGTGYAPS